ncbi:MAG: topoisomerase subunit, partial [Pseudomonadota bacterium]
LRQLARLEAIKIEQELSQLRGEQGRLEDLLGNPAVLRRSVIREIEVDARQYGDERRTLIQAEKRTVAEVKVLDEPVTVVVSQKGWVRSRQGHGHDQAAFAFKAGDGLRGTFECRSVDVLLVFGNNGRVWSVPVSTLPGARGDGQPITSLIELESGVQPLHYLAAAPETLLLLAHSGGTGLLAKVGDMVSRHKAGKAFLTLEAGERLFAPIRVEPTHQQVACLAPSGRVLVYGLDELKYQPGGGRGLILMDVDASDPLLSICTLAQAVEVHGLGRGNKPRVELLKGTSLAIYAGKRARKGRVLESTMKVERLALPAQ